MKALVVHPLREAPPGHQFLQVGGREAPVVRVVAVAAVAVEQPQRPLEGRAVAGLNQQLCATGRVAYIDAELLAVDEGVLVLARHFVFYADGRPQQTSASYLLADMVRDTPIADAANEPWPGGTIAQLSTLGIEVTAVNETVSARMPAPAERQRLHIAEGVPVLCVTRTMLAGDRPVEVAVDVVMPADRFRLDYTISLTEP